MIDVLKAAKDKITDPNKWVKFFIGRNGKGDFSLPNSPETVQWCAAGALECVTAYQSKDYAEAARILNRAAGKISKNRYGHFVGYNDDLDSTHSDVLAMFDLAIEEARANQGHR